MLLRSVRSTLTVVSAVSRRGSVPLRRCFRNSSSSNDEHNNSPLEYNAPIINHNNNNNNDITIMPSPPHSYYSESSSSSQQALVTLDLSTVAEKVNDNETQRTQAFDFSRKIQVALVKAQDAVWDTLPHQAEALQDLSNLVTSSPESVALLQPQTPRTPRPANLSIRMEEVVRLQALKHFLETAHLLPPPEGVTDEEYLAGACMGLAQDLQQYGLGRATVRDVASVQAAKDLCSDILDFLLQLDFRNGPLRRKYDGTKYCVRSLETLLYELSITGANGSNEEAEPTPSSKKTKHESTRLPNEALAGIKERMEHRDSLRESLIKQCRDSQKAAKQAIFALHRGDKAKATQLIAQCETSIQNDLFPIVQEEPPLRMGSFGNVLEEYVEAKLFDAWLGPHTDDSSQPPAARLLAPSDFPMALEPEDFVNGLCDLTGEVGRFAVQRGTVRDAPSVQLCLQTNHAILSGLQSMEHAPHGTHKKMDTVRRSVEKLQRMLYEMSLSEAAGRSVVATAGDVEMEDTKQTNVDE